MDNNSVCLWYHGYYGHKADRRANRTFSDQPGSQE